MDRNYHDWIDAYIKTFSDGFIPPKFIEWAAISAVAAVLERKVWLPVNMSYTAYPNLYIMLVAGPGVGKSSAIQPAVKLLDHVSKYGTKIQMLPSQVTEAKLVDILAKGQRSFEYKNRIMPQTPFFYYASEASASMKDIYGGFTAILTELFDCNDKFERATKGDGAKSLSVVKPCINILAGSTFDYLHKLIGDGNIMGGFASRLVYVVQKEKFERSFVFGHDRQVDPDRYDCLLMDLHHIYKTLRGPFRGTKEFATAWNEWNTKNDQLLQGMASETLQALMARSSTLMNKLAMILCASTTDDMTITKEHWDRGLALMDDVNENLAYMLREGKSRDTKTQSGINSYILKIVNDQALPPMELIAKATLAGFKAIEVKSTLEHLLVSKEVIKINTQGCLELIGDADTHI